MEVSTEVHSAEIQDWLLFIQNTEMFAYWLAFFLLSNLRHFILLPSKHCYTFRHYKCSSSSHLPDKVVISWILLSQSCFAGETVDYLPIVLDGTTNELTCHEYFVLQQAHCSIPGMAFSPKHHHIELRRASCHKPLQHCRYVGREGLWSLRRLQWHTTRLFAFCTWECWDLFFFQILEFLV